MKKVLALFLVLGLATVSSAAIELGIGDLATKEITLVSSEQVILVVGSPEPMLGVNTLVGPTLQSPGAGHLVLGDPVGSSVNVYKPPVVSDAPGYWSYFDPASSADFGYTEIVWVQPLAAVAAENGAGIWWDIPFHCDGPGDVIIQVFDEGLNVLDEIVIHQIPEPMTMSLLALGGLGLIRRRRA
jgi:hypothetical protein